MSLPKDAIYIVGGGIVGVSTAYFLSKTGAKVVVLEKNKIGHGCSFANAGWLTPCFAMPLPMPGMFLKSLKWLMNPNSPLYIKPSANPDLLKWLYVFLKSMNEKQALLAIEALVQLSQRSLELYKQLSNENPGKMSFEQKGLLMVAKSNSGLQSIYQELDLVSKFGVRGKTLDPGECINLEPALRQGIIGGVHFQDEAHAEPLATTQLIAEIATKQGVIFLEGADFLEFSTSAGRIDSISYQHQGATHAAKPAQVILTTGSWSKSIGKKIGVNLPIMGGKGYSMNVLDIAIKPKIPVMFLEKKIAITPRQQGIRIAGTLELVDQDDSITQRRVRNIQTGAADVLNISKSVEIKDLWVGLRPCSPDGVPLIGASKKYQNLLLGLGHQMLGFQSGLGSGELLAKIANGYQHTAIEKVFDPNRF